MSASQSFVKCLFHFISLRCRFLVANKVHAVPAKIRIWEIIHQIDHGTTAKTALMRLTDLDAWRSIGESGLETEFLCALNR